MFNEREMLFGAEFGNKVLEALVSELCPIVGDERLWYTESGNHVSFVETKDVVWCDFGQGFSLYPLYEIVDDHDQEFLLI